MEDEKIGNFSVKDSILPIEEYFDELSDISEAESLSHASHEDLAFEWSMLCQDCTDCWTGTGKTYF